MRWIHIIAMALLTALTTVQAAELTKIEPAYYLEHPNNDGDSFWVTTDIGDYIVRLYFVDCPEATSASEVDARRLREQSRYFGLEDALHTLREGQRAAQWVQQHLQDKPLTLYTTFASGGGRSTAGRIYAFVILPDGTDLAASLVARGFARAHGVRREGPDGTHRDDIAAHLSDLELSAVMRKVGVWTHTDPERLVELRQAQRVERKEIATLMGMDNILFQEELPLDLNTVSKAQLLKLPGIGPVYAQRIIDHRPYQSINDLQSVPGFSPNRVKALRDMIYIKTP